MDTIKIPPYGQHFNCAERMLGKSRYRVFSRLMDECSTIIAREQMNRYFTISVSSLSYRAGGMDRTLVNSVLEWLKKRSIISISSAGEIMVNIGLYISLIDKFNSIDKKDEPRFIQDLENCEDMSDLYGLQEISTPEAIKILMMMKGCRKTDNTVGKSTDLSENIQTCRKIDSVVGKSTILSENRQVLPVGNPTDLSENRQHCRKIDTIEAKLSAIIHELSQENETLDDETLKMLQNWTSSGDMNIEIDGKSTVSFIALVCMALERVSENLQTCRKTDTPLSIFLHSKYKYNINIKENVLNERSEFSIEGKEKKTGFEGLDIIELHDNPSIPSKKHNIPSKFHNPYINKPFFSRKEAERFTANVEECINSPVKLFYYNFWGGLYDFYLDNRYVDSDTDENGNVISDEQPSDLDMLGTLIPVRDFLIVMNQAYQETIDNSEAGFISTENGDIKVNVLPISDLMHPEYFIEWKRTKDADGNESVVVSLEGFRNIEAEDVAEVKPAKSRDEKKMENRENKKFIAAVLKTDESDLTPVEKAIKRFCAAFISMDEYYNVIGFKNEEGAPIDGNKLPGYIIRPWFGKNTDIGIAPEDLYSVLNVPGNYRDGEDIPLMATVFSYQKAKRWNGLHEMSSVINDEAVEKALNFDD